MTLCSHYLQNTYTKLGSAINTRWCKGGTTKSTVRILTETKDGTYVIIALSIGY